MTWKNGGTGVDTSRQQDEGSKCKFFEVEDIRANDVARTENGGEGVV